MPEVKALLWLDLETDGGEPHLDGTILELGAVLTDLQLTELGEYEAITRLTETAWKNMRAKPVVLQMHRDNGLIEDLENQRDGGLSTEALDVELVRYLKDVVPHLEPGSIQIAGSGVAHFDFNFVKSQMPELRAMLHYAAVDIGVMRRCLRLFGAADWVPNMPKSSGSEKAHRGLADAREHLLEARAYRELFASVRNQLEDID